MSYPFSVVAYELKNENEKRLQTERKWPHTQKRCTGHAGIGTSLSPR